MMIELEFPKKILEKHGQELFSDFCKYLYYKKVDAKKKLIQIRKENKTFYIILVGKVSVNLFLVNPE